MATGQTDEYRNDEHVGPWAKTPVTYAITQSGVQGSCDDCRISPATFNCQACMATTRVKLCGRNMPGPELAPSAAQVAVQLPWTNSTLPLHVQLRAAVTGCFGPKGTNPCSDQPEGGGFNEWLDLTVRPHEHVGLSTELAVTFKEDYSVKHGGYVFSARGSVLAHSGAEVRHGLQPGSELRITLGQISYVRTVSRISEIVGLVGGAMGIFITVLGFCAVGLEKPQVRRAITIKRKARPQGAKPATATADEAAVETERA